MASKYSESFFDKKRPWSIYKDHILDYYLQPYLTKVKNLRKPMLVVDLFAGRGSFESGEDGSPLIIAKKMDALLGPAVKKSLLCFETLDAHFPHLQQELQPFPFAEAVHASCVDHIDRVAELAKTHTVLLYVDPCDPADLDLAQLAKIYEHVPKSQSSVEVLLVFMARGFMREATRFAKAASENMVYLDKLVVEAESEEEKIMWMHAIGGGSDLTEAQQAIRSEKALCAIAGGDYWKKIAERLDLDWNERCQLLVEAYQKRLGTWFRVAESYPIRADSGSQLPRYWIVFGTRYAPALDLFNDAACSAARHQRQNFRQPGSLFANQPAQKETVPDSTVDRAVLRASAAATPCSWSILRWATCRGRSIGMFKQGEINASIKRLLQNGMLVGPTGSKIEEDQAISLSEAGRSRAARLS